MAVYNSQMFYLGNFAQMDTDETDFDAENPSLVLGNYSSPNLVNVVAEDANNDSVIDDDELGTSSGEDVSYNVGAGPTTQFIDTTIVYNISVLLGDGSTVTMLATAIQTQNGDVFLTDFANNGSFDNLNIQSFELTSVFNSDYTGFYADSSVDDTSVVCFAEGTLIETLSGVQAVDTLCAGDKVKTLDHGYVPLKGVYSTAIGKERSRQPVRIPKNTLGQGMPRRDLIVSVQHRLRVSSQVAMRMFGEREVFVSAKALIGHKGVHQDANTGCSRYYHLVCDKHEIVFAEGCPAETFFAGDYAVETLLLSPVGRFALSQMNQASHGRMILARYAPSMSRQKKLVYRLFKNGRSFWEDETQITLQATNG